MIENLGPGVSLLDKHRGRERLVRAVERLGRVVKIWFDDPSTGGMEPFIFPVTEVEERFEILPRGTAAFQADSEIVRLVAECHRLAHAYLFNPLFATETSLIDLLPHQLIAVYDHLLEHPRLRFLLADDAGAGKTIMTGLYIREMLLRRLVERVLIVPPAGLIGNWERELRNLFRLRFRIVSSSDGDGENPLDDPRNDLRWRQATRYSHSVTSRFATCSSARSWRGRMSSASSPPGRSLGARLGIADSAGPGPGSRSRAEGTPRSLAGRQGHSGGACDGTLRPARSRGPLGASS